MAFIVIQNTKTRKLSGTGIDCVWLIKKNKSHLYGKIILDIFRIPFYGKMSDRFF